MHVHASFNNTIVTFTDVSGETLVLGFCWNRWLQGCPQGHAICGNSRCRAMRHPKAKRMGVREVEVRIKGPGSGREAAVTGLITLG